MARKPGSKNNAITHGAYAKDLILPGESVREFNLIHRGLIEEWEPVGTLKKIRCLLSQNTFGKRAAPTDFISGAIVGATASRRRARQ